MARLSTFHRRFWWLWRTWIHVCVCVCVCVYVRARSNFFPLRFSRLSVCHRVPQFIATGGLPLPRPPPSLSLQCVRGSREGLLIVHSSTVSKRALWRYDFSAWYCTKHVELNSGGEVVWEIESDLFAAKRTGVISGGGCAWIFWTRPNQSHHRRLCPLILANDPTDKGGGNIKKDDADVETKKVWDSDKRNQR